MISSPKNESPVINHSTSCRYKSVRLSFIFEPRMKILLMKSESFLSFWHFDASKSS